MTLTDVLIQSPAIVQLSDTTNGTLDLGYCPSVSISERALSHKNIQHDQKRYDQILTLKVRTEKSAIINIENDLRAREATAQDVIINAIGYANNYRVKSVFIVINIKRRWGKTKGVHTIDIIATFRDPAKIIEDIV